VGPGPLSEGAGSSDSERAMGEHLSVQNNGVPWAIIWLASAGLSFQLVAVELKAGLVAAAQASVPGLLGYLRDGGVGLLLMRMVT